jgi:large subunit ribosomal protein L15
MLKLSSLRPYKGATKRRKVVGRGVGSGHGTFSGKGAKGQKARSGGKIPVGFEGGNMPLHRQLPKKRGFRSLAAKAQAVNLKDLSEIFESGATINPKVLESKGLIKSAMDPVKILGEGATNKSFNFEKIQISAKAREVIEKAGGKIS